MYPPVHRPPVKGVPPGLRALRALLLLPPLLYIPRPLPPTAVLLPHVPSWLLPGPTNRKRQNAGTEAYTTEPGWRIKMCEGGEEGEARKTRAIE